MTRVLLSGALMSVWRIREVDVDLTTLTENDIYDVARQEEEEDDEKSLQQRRGKKSNGSSYKQTTSAGAFLI